MLPHMDLFGPMVLETSFWDGAMDVLYVVLLVIVVYYILVLLVLIHDWFFE